MLYLNTIEQLFLFVEQLDQLEVFLPYSRVLTGIPILVVFKNLRWNSNKTSLPYFWAYDLFPFYRSLPTITPAACLLSQIYRINTKSNRYDYFE